MTNNPFELALKQEGIDGDVANIARSIYQQESRSGKNTQTSNAGARGGMQIIPATFNRMADKGWLIDDPVQNARAGLRYVALLHNKSGGDPALTAAGYYGGEGAITKAKKGIAVSDPRNPKAPNTLEYGKQVADRLPKEDLNALWDNAKPDEDLNALWDSAKPNTAAPEPAKSPTTLQKVKSFLDQQINMKDVAGGIGRGAVDVGGGIAMPLEYAYDKITGNKGTHDTRVKRVDANFADNFNTNTDTYKNSRTGGQILATLPVGGVLGAGAKAVGMEALGSALGSGGLTLGKTGGNAIVNGATRVSGGAITGGVSEALVNNGDYGMGAGIGGAIPIAAGAAGLAGKGVGFLHKYLTQNGQNSHIADKMLDVVGNGKLDFINRLKTLKGATPGFNPTVGQMGGSHEMASFERAMQQRNPGLFQDSVNSQNMALANASKGFGADESSLSAMVDNRDNAVKPLYDISKNTDVVSDSQLAELMKRPNVKEAFKAASKNAANRGENLTAGQWIESNALHDNGAPDALSSFHRMESARGPKVMGGNEDNLMQAIKKMGGINIGEILDTTGEKTGRAARAQVGMFHKNGLGTDDLASQLHDIGFIPSEEMSVDGGVGYLKDAIKNHLGGDKQYAIHDTPVYGPNFEYLQKQQHSTPNNFSDPVVSKSDIYKGKTLQEVKFALDKFKEFNPIASSSEKATRAGAVDASNSFNDYLGNKIPSIKEANKLFSTLSKQIDQAKVGNALHEKFVPAIYRGKDSPVFENGANSLNVATLAKILRDSKTGNNLARNVTGFSGSTLKNSLSKDQYKTLENIVSDTEFMNYGKTSGGNGGSQTGQLGFMNAKGEKNGLLSQMMSHGSLTMRAMQAVKEFAVKPIEQKTAFLLQNPQEAAKLLDSRLSKVERNKMIVDMIAKQGRLVAPAVAAIQSR